jgi:hypothetical protein
MARGVSSLWIFHPIYIFKEDVGIGMYYKLPYISNFNYENVVTFVDFAIPILTEMLKKERDNKLMGSDCIKVSQVYKK